MASFSPSDVLYVTTEYRTMGELCDGRPWSVAEVDARIAAGRLPAATYELPSGERRYPPDYFVLAEGNAGGDLDGVAARFFARYLAAGGTMTEADEDWQGFLTGQFGVCLRAVTPESMVAKNRLVARVEELVGAPAPADDGWCGALCAAVGELDALLRPFTDFDRERWGDTSRDRLVGRVRARWPAVFAACREGRERSLRADAIA
jgi:hypothetical protein